MPTKPTYEELEARIKALEAESIQRQITKAELRKSLLFTESLLMAIPTPVFFKDAQGRYQGCNQAFTEIMGVSNDEIRGKTVQELWPGEHAHVYHQKDLDVMRHPAHQSYEFVVKDKNGIERPVIFNKDVFRNEKGEVAGIVGSFLDISELKHAKLLLQAAYDELEQRVIARTAELEHVNQQLKLEIHERQCAEATVLENFEFTEKIISESAIGIAVYNAEGQCISANNALAAIVGADKTQVLNQNYNKIETWEKTGLLEKAQSAISLNRKLRHEIEVESTFGKHVVIECHLVPFGQNHLLLMVNDITDRKKYQKRLRALSSELLLAEEKERRRIAEDLHDGIGQNLAFIKIKLDALQPCISSPELAETLRQSQSILAQTIQDLRSLTIQISPAVLYKFGLKAAVEWLIEQIQDQHDIKITFRHDRHPLNLSSGIRVLLFRSIRELLLNIVKHANASNTQITIEENANDLQVRIEDDGIGFTPANLDTVNSKFNKFGLFSIHERMENVGGRLEVDAKPGCGSRFRLIIPLANLKSP